MRVKAYPLLPTAASIALLAACALAIASSVSGWKAATVALSSLALILAVAVVILWTSPRKEPESIRGGVDWRRWLDSIPLAALLVDGGGRIAFANNSCLELIEAPGDSRAPMTGKQIGEAFLPPYFGNWDSQLKKARGSKRSVVYPHEQYFMEGRSGVCRVWISSLLSGAGEGGLSLLLIQDITEETGRHDALLEARDREVGIFEGVPVKIAILDGNFRLVRCNRLMQKWIRDACGIEDPALQGLPALDIMPQEFRADWKHILRRVLIEGRSFEQPRVHNMVADTEYYHRVRLHPLMDDAGNIKEALLLYEDVTEYVRLERRLAETTDYFNLLIEGVNDGFYAMDSQGKFSFCNQAFLEMLGMSDSEELYQKEPTDIVIPEESDKIVHLLERRRRGENVFFDTFLRRQDGAAMPVHISSAPLFRAGRFMGIVGIAHDLSERRRLEAMVEQSHQYLERAYEELSVLDKMKSDFIAIASHELRTPLSIIKGYADAFQFGELGELDSFQIDKIIIMNSRADQMTKIINDLLDVTRLEEGRLVGEKWPAPLDELIVNAVSEYKGQAAKAGQELCYSIEDDLPPVSIDVWRVHQVMENLIGNALKFTPEGGKIEVVARRATDPGMVEIEVRDTGPGIPRREQKRLFTIFYQVETNSTRPAGGLGLGLMISKGIVEGHGGRIWVESEEGGGSSFKFTLPTIKEG
ncbi:MAG: PAS domain S-box protein [Actinomycetota bacterium]|nr:PAS domain S-box protein [Actinomycetota bacterium]